MSTNYDYLSKSTVTSPSSGRKPNYDYYLGASTVGGSTSDYTSPTFGRKQWGGTNDYKDIKKVAGDISNLRQTFDVRTNSNIRDRLTKYEKNYDDNMNYSNYESTTQKYNLTSPKNKKDLTSSAVNGYSDKKDEYSSYLDGKGSYRSPQSEKRNRKDDIDQKFKKYVETVQNMKDFKDQIESTCKVNEELKKLKEDRKRRLEEKEKELNELERKLKNEGTSETFKKKKYYEYYTPKEEKSSAQDRLYSDKYSTSNLDLSKYKSSTNDLTKSSYKTSSSYLPTEPKSAMTKKSYDDPKKTKPIYIKDFILGKVLGQGKFGVVYQAIHRPTGWLFAIKKVPKQTIKSHLMIDQFILEMKIQSFLNSQYILSLFHYFDDKTSIYLVLEYMEGGTLFTHLKKQKTLGEKEVAQKIKEVTTAVKYMHDNIMAHRDIKPENIVMSHGVCKLCDFGWSTICDDRRKTYCGTFDYAPPQILQGVQYDYTVDLWCLGVLAYELLVGQAPFYHISRKQTMKKIMNVQKTNVEYPSHLSQAAVDFINDLIRKDPKSRLSCDQILAHRFLKCAQQKNMIAIKDDHIVLSKRITIQ